MLYEKDKGFRSYHRCFFCLNSWKGIGRARIKPPPSKPINIVVILDTSDRVSTERSPGQAARDIEIAKDLVNFYYEGARLKMFQTYDRLAFVVPNQPEVPPILPEIIRRLKIWSTKKDRRCGHPCFEKIKVGLLSAIDELYQLLEKQKEFTGSDIWKWFRASGEAYLKKDMQNYIICLSDGYLDFNRS